MASLSPFAHAQTAPAKTGAPAPAKTVAKDNAAPAKDASVPAATATALTPTATTDAADKGVFTLGTVVVYGQPLSPSDKIEASLFADSFTRLDKYNLADAITTTPGVVINHSGGRGEKTVFVRGFTSLQVPIYIDGVPAYVPYDGNMDLNRFTTFDIAAIHVAKGYSSVLYGPNTMGGAINLVSRRPTLPFEGSLMAGVFEGKGYEAAINAGGVRGKWYWQTGFSYIRQDYFPMSDDYKPSATNPNEDGGHRNNSDFEDWKFSAKIAYAPNETDEYALGFVYQEGAKAQPPYGGEVLNERYWRWPQYDKYTVYFVSNTRIAEKSWIKPRFYFDTYQNKMVDYGKDATYTTPSASTDPNPSFYDDYSWGTTIEIGTELLPRQVLKAAFHYKYDNHWNQTKTSGVMYDDVFEDQTISIGVEDTITILSSLKLQLGVSYDWREMIDAVDTNTSPRVHYPSKSFDSINPQAGLFYDLTPNDMFHATVALKSRFPSIKDRYSYRFGRFYPNEKLGTETALHYELGYNGRPIKGLNVSAAAFYSDIDDLIANNNYSGPDGVKPRPENIAKAESYGIELGGEYVINDVLTFGGSYTWMEKKNRSDKSLKITYIPQHFGIAYADIKPVDFLTFTPSIEFSSYRYHTESGAKLPGYATVNLSVTVQLPHNLSLRAGVRNIFDKNYAVSEGYPEAGRTFFGNLTWRF
jgi:iron complex outermembrane receptor protein